MDTKKLLNKLVSRKDLTKTETAFILRGIINGQLSPIQGSAFLTALRTKGESAQEILGLIAEMRSHMLSVQTQDKVLDIVGSGGDGHNTFNISTAAAFIAAGAGVKIAKHGNRAASSQCGSADVLEALGVNINLTPAQAAHILRKTGMVFLFAPLFHPATKNVGPIRKELGFRTVFNFLGPFLNPAKVKYSLIGLPDKDLAEKLSVVAKGLGFKHLIIFSSHDGMDEISLSAPTTIIEIKNQKTTKKIIRPSNFGFKTINKSKIIGGNPTRSASILREILEGKKGPRRDIAVLNAAFALYIGGKVKTPKQGIKLAEESIDSGKALKVLEGLILETNKYV